MSQKHKQWISREVWGAASEGKKLRQSGGGEFSGHMRGLLQAREVFCAEFGSHIQQSF